MKLWRRRKEVEKEERRASLWDEQADAYWKRMEPSRKRKRWRVQCVLLSVLIVTLVFGAMNWRQYGGWDSWQLAEERRSDEMGMNMTQAQQDTWKDTVDANIRATCRVRGVQTRWHEEMCRNVCQR